MQDFVLAKSINELSCEVNVYQYRVGGQHSIECFLIGFVNELGSGAAAQCCDGLKYLRITGRWRSPVDRRGCDSLRLQIIDESLQTDPDDLGAAVE